jgi:hypothetical protein
MMMVFFGVLNEMQRGWDATVEDFTRRRRRSLNGGGRGDRGRGVSRKLKKAKKAKKNNTASPTDAPTSATMSGSG